MRMILRPGMAFIKEKSSAASSRLYFHLKHHQQQQQQLLQKELERKVMVNNKHKHKQHKLKDRKLVVVVEGRWRRACWRRLTARTSR